MEKIEAIWSEESGVLPAWLPTIDPALRWREYDLPRKAGKDPDLVVLGGSATWLLERIASWGEERHFCLLLLVDGHPGDSFFTAVAGLENVEIFPRPISPEFLRWRFRSWLRERKAAELQPASLAEFLDSLVENIPNMVFVKDARELRFVRFNRAGEQLLGYPRSTLIGKNDFDLFPEAQARFFTEVDRAVLEGSTILDIPEEVIQTRFLGERILRTKKIPIFGPAGEPEYLLGISEDITNLKRADQERIRLVREQAVLEARAVAGRRTMFLAEASMLFANSLDYRHGLARLADFLVPDYCDWCSLRLKRRSDGEDEASEVVAERGDVALGNTVVRYRERGREGQRGDISLDGENKFYFQESALGLGSGIGVPIAIGDRILGVMLFARHPGYAELSAEDLATAEELGRRVGMAVENAYLYETAQRAVRTRDEFLSIASHELKTPMTSLKLQIQMTRRAVDPSGNRVPSAERLAKVLDISAAQVNRLNALVDDLLDVSRIESGKLTYQFEHLDFGLLVREVVDRYSEQLAAARCQLALEAGAGVMVNADRFRLEQVVLNLLSNATKYGRGRAIAVTVGSGDGAAFLAVRDHGIGIPEDKWEKVFECFERVESSHQISGLGLGLYISRQIVKAHRGKISVESKMGVGSTFTVRLPLAEAGEERAVG